VEDVPVDVRVLAATSVDLEARVAEGRFRSDLFYRINVFRIHLPALEERPADIPELVTYFARKHSVSMGKPVTRVSEGLIQTFAARRWPGNVRELENAVRRALAVSQGEVLSQEGEARGATEEDSVQLRTCAARSLEGFLAAGHDSPFHAFVAAAERAVIEEALSRAENNLSAAARTLGMSRFTLRKKAQEFGIRDV
jgi:DNA-binding NtrC family response regulator